MNSILIIIIVTTIIQTLIGYWIYRRVQKLEYIFPENLSIEIQEKYIPKEWLSQKTTEEIISKSLQPASKSDSILENAFATVLQERIVFLKNNASYSPIFQNILQAFNQIIIKKRELFSMDLAQNITESHVQTQRPTLFLNAPLILAGIATAFTLFFWISENPRPESIIYLYHIFMQIGQVAAFTLSSGLIISLFLKNSREKAIGNFHLSKSRFYTFLQTEVLPSANNQSLNSIIFVLQQNLETFNTRFTTNMDSFEKTVQTLQENHKIQRDFVEKLDQLSLNKISAFNLQVIERFENVILKFHQFESWFEGINQNTEQSIKLSKRLDSLITAADQMGMDLGKISTNIDNRLDQSHQLTKFLKSHFSELEDRKQLINHAVIDFDNFMKNALQELETHTQERVDAIREITVQEEDMMIKVFSKNRDALSQLNHLTELSIIREKINNLSTNYEKESTYMTQGIRSLISKLETANQNLETIRIKTQNN